MKADLDRIPFPVAYPLHWARDEARATTPGDRIANAIFTCYQALRLTALLLLADYLRRDDLPAEPRVGECIRALRLPHWGEWSALADELVRYWNAPGRAGQSRFPGLVEGWRRVARVRAGAGARSPEPDPALVPLIEAVAAAAGLAGNDTRDANRDANRAIQAYRNRRSHRAAVANPRTQADLEAEARPLLALAEGIVATLFAGPGFRLLRVLEGPGELRCADLSGPHLDLAFPAEPAEPAFAEALAGAWVAARAGDEAIQVYPFLVPCNLPEAVDHDPATMLDGISDAKLVTVGVERFFIYGRGDPHLGAALAALGRRHADLTLGRERTTGQAVAPWSRMTAGLTLEALRGRKYFPAFHVERPGVDEVLERLAAAPGGALLVLGEAGAGKSSLVARWVDGLLGGAGQEPSASPAARAATAAEQEDVVLYLSGRADFAGDAGAGGDQLLADAVARKAGVRAGAFASLADLLAQLAARQREDPRAGRRIWLLLDGLNEADRYADLVRALDAFLPHLAELPAARLLVAMRSGAYFALVRRDRDLGTHGIPGFAHEHHFLAFTDADGRTRHWLEARRFRREPEGAAAHALRRDAAAPATAAVPPMPPWDRLRPGLQELLLNPLYLHLYHQTWADRAGQAPLDLDEDALFDAYLGRLASETGEGIAGAANWLDRLGTLMLENRRAFLAVEEAEAWAREWRQRLGAGSARSAAKLDPVEELVSANVLLRPVEEGSGAARSLSGYQFAHEKLAQRLLLREIDRRIAPRTLPDREAFARVLAEATNPAPFAELLGALAGWIGRLARAGQGETLTPILDTTDAGAFNVLVEALVGAACGLDPDAAESLLATLAEAARNGPDGGERLAIAVANEAVGREPRTAIEVVRGLYSQIHALFEALADRHPDDPRRRHNHSWSLGRLADLDRAAGRIEAARERFERMLAIDEDLSRRDPDNLEFRRDVSLSLERLADLDRAAGRIEAARERFDRMRAIREDLARRDPDNLQFRRDVSVSLDRLAELDQATGRIQAARAGFEKSLAICEDLARRDPDNLQIRSNVSIALERLSDLDWATGRSKAARAGFEQALAIGEDLVRRDPDNLRFRRNVLLFHERIAEIDRDTGRSKAARAGFEQALAIGEDLVRRDPDNLQFGRDVSASLSQLAELDRATGRIEEARGGLEKALAIREDLVRRNPDNLQFWSNVLVFHERIAEIDRDTGRSKAARAGFEQALAIGEDLVRRDPDNLQFRRDVSASLSQLADLDRAAGRSNAARTGFEKALAIAEDLAHRDPHNLRFLNDVSLPLDRLAELDQAAGRIEEARGGLEKALAIREDLVRRNPDNLHFWRNVFVFHERIAELDQATGRSKAARAGFEQALAIGEDLVRRDPDNLQFRRDVSASLNQLADLDWAAGRSKAARTGFEKALAIAEDLARRDPDNLRFLNDVSLSLHRLAELDRATGRIEEARGGLEKALAIREDLVRRNPDNLQFWRNVLVFHERIAKIDRDTGRIQAARAGFEKSLAICEDLARRDPDNLQFLSGVSASLNRLAELDGVAGRMEAAREGFKRALAIAEDLARRAPDNLQFRHDVSTSLYELAKLERAARRIEPTRAGFEKALAIAEDLTRRDPDNLQFLGGVSASLSQLAELEQDTGRMEAARKGFEKALAIREDLVRRDPDNLRFRHDMNRSAVQLRVANALARLATPLNLLSAVVFAIRGNFPESGRRLRLALGRRTK